MGACSERDLLLSVGLESSPIFEHNRTSHVWDLQVTGVRIKLLKSEYSVLINITVECAISLIKKYF